MTGCCGAYLSSLLDAPGTVLLWKIPLTSCLLQLLSLSLLSLSSQRFANCFLSTPFLLYLTLCICVCVCARVLLVPVCRAGRGAVLSLGGALPQRDAPPHRPVRQNQRRVGDPPGVTAAHQASGEWAVWGGLDGYGQSRLRKRPTTGCVEGGH